LPLLAQRMDYGQRFPVVWSFARKKTGTGYPEASSQKRSLLSEQSYREWEVVTPGDTPDFNIEPDGGMTPPAEFTYHGHQVEIVPPDPAHLIGNYWQIKIDGVIRGNFLFSSARMAADEAKKLIDTGLFP